MITKRIIPCLDVANGRVVKGINFVDLQDAGDPVEQAKIYSDGGADEICFLDITASNENRDTIYDVVEKTSKKCFVPLTVGGGVRSVEDINKLLNCGADKVSINTAAVENSKVVIDSSKKFGSQCIVVAIDAKKNGDKWEVFTHGGRNNSGIDALEYAKKINKSKKVRDKISCLVKHRIKEIDKHKVCAKDVLGQALLPYNTPTFMHQLWDTADNMWIGIGDKTPHSDTNYYTKRIILCGVIASSIMFWVSDKGNEVDEFIDRRINDALKLGKIKKPESLKILKQFSKFMPHINHPLKMRD